jgi:hypothetical protein
LDGFFDQPDDDADNDNPGDQGEYAKGGVVGEEGEEVWEQHCQLTELSPTRSIAASATCGAIVTCSARKDWVTGGHRVDVRWYQVWEVHGAAGREHLGGGRVNGQLQSARQNPPTVLWQLINAAKTVDPSPNIVQDNGQASIARFARNGAIPRAHSRPIGRRGVHHQRSTGGA